MQVNRINNNQSFGINAIRFADEESFEIFRKATNGINDKKMSKLIGQIKTNCAPKNKPDVDVFVLGYKNKLTNDEWFNMIAKDSKGQPQGIISVSSEKISPKKLKHAFQVLMDKVDAYGPISNLKKRGTIN